MNTGQGAHSPIPQGNYVSARRHGGLVYTAGMTPRENGRMMFHGPFGPGRLHDRREAVLLACGNALRAVEDVLYEGEEIAALLSMTVYVVAGHGVNEHSRIADIASDYLQQRLGERGICSRWALGVASLPDNAPVEIQLIAAV